MVVLLSWPQQLRRFERGLSNLAVLSAPRKLIPGPSVSELRHSEGPISMRAVKIQPPHLSIERGAAHAKRFGGHRNIAFGARECPLQHPALGCSKVLRHFPWRS